MAWFRVDDKFRGHRKVLSIPRKHRRDAVALWFAAGIWCAEQSNDGHVPTYMIDEFEYTLDDALALQAAGLWEVSETDGWVFHDWAEYNPLREELMAKQIAKQDAIRAARSEAGKRGAVARWGKETTPAEAETEWQTKPVTAGQDGKAMANTESVNGKMANDAYPTRPDPTRPEPLPEKEQTLTHYVSEGRSPAKLNRATRIPEPFTITNAMRCWATTNVPGMDIDRVTLRFVNHWTAKPGQGGTKLDWGATWRNWMLKDYDDRPANRGGRAGPTGDGLTGGERKFVRAVAAGREVAAMREARNKPTHATQQQLQIG